MDPKIERIYVPMTETSFYILLNLRQENHGYGIAQNVENITNGEVRIGPGTMYGTLSKMEKDHLIAFKKKEGNRKLYQATPLGLEILAKEVNRIQRMYKNIQVEYSK